MYYVSCEYLKPETMCCMMEFQANEGKPAELAKLGITIYYFVFQKESIPGCQSFKYITVQAPHFVDKEMEV